MYLIVLLGVLGSVVAQDSGLFELNIIHYNDFHAQSQQPKEGHCRGRGRGRGRGRSRGLGCGQSAARRSLSFGEASTAFDEVSPSGGVCNPAEDACIGGFARLYTAVMEAKEAEPDSLVLNGGDTFQGTIWYNFLRWNVTQHFMNMLPHDAHVLGNHEFDHGVEGLVPYLEHLNSPMLGANVNTAFEPDMTPYVHNHIVVVRNGRRIGIIGVLLRTFSAPIGGVIMEDELEAINREAAILTEQGVDIIIVLSHVGFDTDQRLALLVSPEVDIIVGAHSHTLLFTGEPPNGDTPASDYPTVVTRNDGHRIPIVQASCYTRYLGTIKLFIDDAGVIQSWEGQPVFLGSSVVQDPRMLELLEPWRQTVDAVGKEVLGRSLVTLNRGSCRTGECNLGSWACDGFLEELMPRRTGSAWTEAHVCLINSGGLRVQINPGNVTTESLLMAMPFENYVQVYDLKGRHLLEAIEFSVSSAQTTPGEFNSGRMVQIGGMRNVYNASAPAMSRVVSATVRCIDCDVPRFLPLDLDATYRVVTQDYIGEGGSGFTMLSENRENLVNLDVDYVMLQRFMRRQGTVMRDLDGRIQIVH